MEYIAKDGKQFKERWRGKIYEKRKDIKDINIKRREYRMRGILSLNDYFKKVILDNQDILNDSEIAEALGISRKSVWENRKKFNAKRSK